MNEPNPPAPLIAPLRVLVVDDLTPNQHALGAMLESEPGIEVVGCAGDGEDALRQALALKPGCICLDLQMPRMDGFTFLRLLMARQPTPVIVVSSNSRKQDVFKALELGALEFVPKPDPQGGKADVQIIRDELLRKVAAVRKLQPLPPELQRAPMPAAQPTPVPVDGPRLARHRTPGPPSRLVVIGASTGGPGAVVRLLGAMPRGLPIGYAIAQHMPERFTTSFADRLARSTGFDVREASNGDQFLQGRVLIAPGGHHLKVVRTGAGAASRLGAVVVAADPRDGRPYAPSVDLLFETAAEAMGARVCAVVLTGMGSDGREGVARVKEAGGLALAESEQSALVYGMPKQAASSGMVDEVLSLDDIVIRLRRFGEQKP